MRVRPARLRGRSCSLPGVRDNQFACRVNGRGAADCRGSYPARRIARPLRLVHYPRHRRLCCRKVGRHTVGAYPCCELHHGVVAAACNSVGAGVVVGSGLALDPHCVSSDRISGCRVHPAALVECGFSPGVLRQRTGAGLRWRVGHARMYRRFEHRRLVWADPLSIPESQEASGIPSTPIGDTVRSTEARSSETRPRNSSAIRSDMRDEIGRRESSCSSLVCMNARWCRKHLAKQCDGSYRTVWWWIGESSDRKPVVRSGFVTGEDRRRKNRRTNPQKTNWCCITSSSHDIAESRFLPGTGLYYCNAV